MERLTMQLDRTIEYFLNAKRSDNRSQATIDTYSHALYRFAREMPEVGEVSDIDANVLRAYSVKLQETPTLNDVSVTHHMRHIKAFLGWCKAEDYLRSNPMEGGRNARVKLPKFKKPERTLVSVEDFRKMLAVCDNATELGRRDTAVLMLLYDSGLRVGELVGLRVDDLNLKSRTAVVTGKGNKDRTIFFSAQAAVALTRHLSRRKREEEYVFPGYRKYVGGGIKVGGVEQRVRRIAQMAGVTAPTNPHNFRHTFATNYLALGGDVVTLQAILGHEDVSTTVRNYVHQDDETISKRHDQFSPLARLVGGRR